MSTVVIFVIIFIASMLLVIGVLYWQWRKVRNGTIVVEELNHTDHNHEYPITIRDIGILILYIVKHTIQFIIVQLSKLYFILMRKIKKLSEHKNPKIAQVVSKLKIPPVHPQVKSFVVKTFNETKHKINRVKADLAHLEESIEKRVD